MEALQERKLTPRGRTRLVVEIDEPLHRALKTEAARQGTTMRVYITGLIERGHREEMEGALVRK